VLVDSRTAQISGPHSLLPWSYCKCVKLITEVTSSARILVIRGTGLGVTSFIKGCVKCLSIGFNRRQKIKNDEYDYTSHVCMKFIVVH
jgi:hypothetical protein